MPRRQRTSPSDDENSTLHIPSSPIALNHGRLEAWFEEHEDRIQTFLIKITRKKIILPKVLCMSWLRAKTFGTLEQHLKAQKLKNSLNFRARCIQILFKFSNDILKSSVKGVEKEITRQRWKDVAGLRQRGV